MSMPTICPSDQNSTFPARNQFFLQNGVGASPHPRLQMHRLLNCGIPSDIFLCFITSFDWHFDCDRKAHPRELKAFGFCSIELHSGRDGIVHDRNAAHESYKPVEPAITASLLTFEEDPLLQLLMKSWAPVH